jgi:Uma2 family endonuclease
MAAVFTPTRFKWTVEDYHKLGDAGILDEDSRVELIEGELIEMAPIHGPHMGTVNRLNKMLVLAVGDHGVVSVQNPVTLPPYSEPQPDFTILRPGAGMPASGVPRSEDVLLLIEVADSTVRYDRSTKRRLYAREGIAEYWIVNIPKKCIEVYRDRTADGYATAGELGPGDVASPRALSVVQLDVAAIFA